MSRKRVFIGQEFLNLNILVCRLSWCDVNVQRTAGDLFLFCWEMELCS